MKIRKTIGLMLAIMLTLVLGFRTAQAQDCSLYHTVVKGDSLWKIGKTCNVSVKELAGANPEIINLNLIYPGQKIRIPGKYTPFYWQNPGSERYTGTLMEALKLLGYTPKQAEALLEAVEADEGYADTIKNGDKFGMVFGAGKVRHNTIADFKDKDSVWAMTYKVTVDGTELTLKYSLDCDNWARYQEIKTPEKTVTVPEETIFIPPAETEEEIITETPPEITIPIPGKEPESKWAIEHEPIGGAYVWDNKLAHGWGVYGEYLSWSREEYPWGYANGWSPGIGIYGYYSEGDTETNPHYSWLERGWGPQLGIKYIGMTDDGKPWQWQLKTRYVFEHMSGKNTAGYRMQQYDEKIGVYAEVLKRINPKWIIGATAEGWYAVSRDIDSTWSGDKPSNRNTLALNLLAQYKINDDWQTRGVFTPFFYQGWDRLWGTSALLEARYKETVMVGPRIAVFPFGLSKVYDGVASAGDLTTLTGFVRLELGAPIRNWDRKNRMAGVKKIDEETYGVVENGGETRE